MYLISDGFHKVVSVESGGLKSEKDTMEFCHTYFFKGHPYLMQNIKRKMPISKNNPSISFVKDLEKNGSGVGENEVLAHVLSEIKGLKEKQADWDAKLAVMKRENESLWRELAIFRQKHHKQEQIINRVSLSGGTLCFCQFFLHFFVYCSKMFLHCFFFRHVLLDFRSQFEKITCCLLRPPKRLT